jgi:hypothetical protein
MSARAYQDFLYRAGKPIGLTISWILGIAAGLYLIIGFLGWAFSSVPQHEQFAEQCTLLVGTVEKIEGNYFCAKVTQHETIIPPDIDRYKLECREAGGIPKSRDYLEACYMFEIIEELGPRNAYMGEQ